MSLRAVIPLLLLLAVKQVNCQNCLKNCFEKKKLEGTYVKYTLYTHPNNFVDACKEKCERDKNCSAVTFIDKYCSLCGYHENINPKGQCNLADDENYKACFVRCLEIKNNVNGTIVESVLIGEKHEINCGPNHYVKDTSETSVTAKCGYDAKKGITQFNFDGEKVECIEDTNLLEDMKKAEINQEGCGISYFKKNEKNLQHRSMIIGGEEAIPHSYPWMVRVKRANGRFSSFCGGTLINHQWILTAGHCVGNNERHLSEPEKFTLYLGAHNFNNNYQALDGEIYYAEKVIRHSGYTDYPTNDIALIKLNRRVEYMETIRPICLPTDPNDQLNKKTGVEVIVTGWGKVFEPFASNLSPVLKEASVKTITSSNFKETIKSYDKFIYLDGKGDNICEGDSGGPMIYYDNNHFVQYGVASWVTPMGERCQSTEPSGFTYVAKFIEWIIKNID